MAGDVVDGEAQKEGAPPGGQAFESGTSAERDDSHPSKGRKTKEEGRRISFLTALFPLLTALVGFLVALLSLWRPAAAERDDLADQAATLDRQVENLTVEVSTLQEVNVELEAGITEREATITSLEDERDDLRAAFEESDGRPPGSVQPQPVGIFRETGDQPVTFNRRYGIRLDTLDDNWGVRQTSTSRDLYLSSSSGDLVLQVGSNTVAIMDGPVTYQDCDGATVLQGNLTSEQTVESTMFCMKTLDDRWAFVTILGLDRVRESITLDITVWSLDT